MRALWRARAHSSIHWRAQTSSGEFSWASRGQSSAAAAAAACFYDDSTSRLAEESEQPAEKQKELATTLLPTREWHNNKVSFGPQTCEKAAAAVDRLGSTRLDSAATIGRSQSARRGRPIFFVCARAEANCGARQGRNQRHKQRFARRRMHCAGARESAAAAAASAGHSFGLAPAEKAKPRATTLVPMTRSD